MPKLYFKERIGMGLEIGVQSSQGEPNHQRGVWTCKLKLETQKAAKQISLKIPYLDGDLANKEQAIRKAWSLYEEYRVSQATGGKIAEGINDHIHYLYQLFLEDVHHWGEQNDLTPKNKPKKFRVQGGRGNSYWSLDKYRKAERAYRLHLEEYFCDVLDKRGSTGKSPSIRSVTQRDWDRLSEWLQVNRSEQSAETHLKIITEVNHFYHWAYNHKNEYVDSIPKIKRVSLGGVEGARERMRMEISPEDYKRIIQYTRSKYTDPLNNYVIRDYAYLFHLYILILANTGIRPPTGGNDHTLMKWKDLELTKNGSEYLLYREEKGHKYYATVLPSAKTYIDELKYFYRRHNIDTTDGYVFVHPYDGTSKDFESDIRKERIRVKGEPIYSFRKQWNKMREDLGLMKKGAGSGGRLKQSDAITFSSLRAWYITQRLYSKGGVDIEKLARAVGSSVKQIEIRYLRIDKERQHEFLAVGAYDNSEKKRKYDKLGYYIGHED